MIDYAAAGELARGVRAGVGDFDGDAWVALFTDDAEYHEDPFGTPLVGHNALRAYLLEAAGVATRRRVHRGAPLGLGGRRVLAAWHATFVRRASGQLVRLAGFLTAEVASDGRVEPLPRVDAGTRPGTAG